MHPMGPYNEMRLVGSSTQRCVTLTLPSDIVESLLPNGIELGEQHLTPPGTHPVNLFFYDMFNLRMNFPTLLPNMTYHEHLVGIPYVYASRSWSNWIASGPYYFMTILLLDNIYAITGGLAFWGFPKHRANIRTSNNRYQVSSLEGDRLVSLYYQPQGDFRPITQFPHFKAMYDIMNLPLVSLLPFAGGPLPVASDFDKVWSKASMRPISAITHIDWSYAEGLPTGRFPETGTTRGIDEAWDGAFELRVPFRQGLVYPSWFHPAR